MFFTDAIIKNLVNSKQFRNIVRDVISILLKQPESKTIITNLLITYDFDKDPERFIEALKSKITNDDMMKEITPKVVDLYFSDRKKD